MLRAKDVVARDQRNSVALSEARYSKLASASVEGINGKKAQRRTFRSPFGYHPLLTARSAWDAFGGSANHNSIRCAAVFAGSATRRCVSGRAFNSRSSAPMGNLDSGVVHRRFDYHRRSMPMQEGWD